MKENVDRVLTFRSNVPSYVSSCPVHEPGTEDGFIPQQQMTTTTPQSKPHKNLPPLFNSAENSKAAASRSLISEQDDEKYSAKLEVNRESTH